MYFDNYKRTCEKQFVYNCCKQIAFRKKGSLKASAEEDKGRGYVMTYSAKFDVEFFSSNLAWTRQRYALAGSRRVCVCELVEEGFEGACNERRTYLATSPQPFVVTVTTRAGGGNSHMNGEITIHIATQNEWVIDYHIVNHYAESPGG